MTMRKYLPLLLAAGLLAGCTSWLRHAAYVVGGGQANTPVPAEFPDFPGSRVAVVVFVPQRVEYSYPFARLQLTSRLAAELRDKVKGVTVVDPATVLKYQQEDISWDAMDKTELGRKLGADYVLLVAMLEYTARQPGSANLFRADLAGEVSVYQTSLPEARSQVWQKGDVRVVHPSEGAPGLLPGEAAGLLDFSERLFVGKVIRSFYRHTPEDAS